MTDPGFPSQHTTTTTVTSNTTVRTDIRFDHSYVKTIPGMIKVGQIALNLLGFICIEASGLWATTSRGSWFNFVALTGFWFTLILLVFYLFHIIEKFYKIPWLKIEFVFCTLWTLLYLIAACLAATFHNEAFAAAAFFGFCAMILYGVDAYFKLKAVQTGQLAQGERVINKQTSTAVNSPAY